MNARAFFLALLLAALSGCGAPPLPNGVHLANAETTAQAVLDLWHEEIELPPVYGVPADPACDVAFPDGRRAVGFVNPDGGHCVGGVTVPGTGIWLLLYPEVRYSHNLAHELAHMIHGDDRHQRRGVWEDVDTNLVPAANAWLRARPALDRMEVVK